VFITTCRVRLRDPEMLDSRPYTPRTSLLRYF
jgi:hypothetical protein